MSEEHFKDLFAITNARLLVRPRMFFIHIRRKHKSKKSSKMENSQKTEKKDSLQYYISKSDKVFELEQQLKEKQNEVDELKRQLGKCFLSPNLEKTSPHLVLAKV